MALSRFKFHFTKNWTNPAHFPTTETSEAQVRADMQYLFDELKTKFEAFLDGLLPADIPFPETSGFDAETDTVQKALVDVQGQIAEVSQGAIPDGSLVNQKLADETIEDDKLRPIDTETDPEHPYLGIDGAKLKDGSVPIAKLEGASGGGGGINGSMLVDASVSADKLAGDVALVFAALGTDGKLARNQRAWRVGSEIADSYTLTLTDAETLVSFNSGTGITLTIPNTGSVDFTPGAMILLFNRGAGAVTVQGATGVTITHIRGTGLFTLAQNAIAILVMGARNKWFCGKFGMITDGSVTNAMLAGSIAADKLEGSIPYSKLSLSNGAIPYSKINVGAGDIAFSKLTGAQASHKKITISITASDWDGGTTVTKSGLDAAVTSSATILVAPAPGSSTTRWRNAGVYCSAQASKSLTFTCSVTPTSTITVYAVVLP